MAKPGDQVVLIVYSPEEGIGGHNTEPYTRKDGYIKIDLPPRLWKTFPRVPFRAYANTKQYRKSAYIGLI